MGYEMYITQEKSSLMIEAAAFCGEEIACYPTRAKRPETDRGLHYVSEQDHPCQRLQMPCEDF